MGSTERKRGSERGGSSDVDPQGVRRQTRAFLEAARAAGADQAVDERRRRLIDVYFGTTASLSDLIPEAGGATTTRVRRLLHSGLTTIWEHLPAEAQAAHPREEVIFLKSNKGRQRGPQTPEHRAKLSAANKGKVFTAERRAKISEATKGKPKGTGKGKGRPSPLKGRTLSAETREKMSRSRQGQESPMKGRQPTAETREKISKSLRGRESPMKGRQHTAETREKISEAQRQRWQRRRHEAAEAQLPPPASPTTVFPAPGT